MPLEDLLEEVRSRLDTDDLKVDDGDVVRLARSQVRLARAAAPSASGPSAGPPPATPRASLIDLAEADDWDDDDVDIGTPVPKRSRAFSLHEEEQATAARVAVGDYFELPALLYAIRNGTSLANIFPARDDGREIVGAARMFRREAKKVAMTKLAEIVLCFTKLQALVASMNPHVAAELGATQLLESLGNSAHWPVSRLLDLDAKWRRKLARRELYPSSPALFSKVEPTLLAVFTSTATSSYSSSQSSSSSSSASASALPRVPRPAVARGLCASCLEPTHRGSRCTKQRICWSFNASGCKGSCGFRHVCATCGHSSHGQSGCTSSSSASSSMGSAPVASKGSV